MAAFAFLAAQDAARIKFEAAADDAINRINGRINLHLSLLQSTHALFKAEGSQVSEVEFRAFFQALSIDRNFPGLRGVGYLLLGKPGSEPELEQTIARYRLAGGARVYPASDGELRTPVVLFEPLFHTRGIGFDMFSDPLRRDAIRAALETGEPRATGLLQLNKYTGGEVVPGIVFFIAVEETAPGQTEAAPTGLIFASFRAEDLFASALDSFPQLPVHVEIFDGPISAGPPMFASALPADRALADAFTAQRTLNVGGRTWTVRFEPTAAFTVPTSRVAPLMLGLAGLLLAGAIGIVARYQGRAYNAMEALHRTAEKSLLDKDLMLQEMKHRIKNSIARVLAMARQTASSSKDLDEFSASFSNRLKAMAASQDMLTRSRWQKADLRELLQIELGQVFGKELPAEMLSGPAVLLSEATTQALGLTFHELATNALKYGDAARQTDALTVRWDITARPAPARLVLIWRENHGRQVEPPERTGFGTKLIDMNITRELTGQIERRYGGDGLEIEIDVPV